MYNNLTKIRYLFLYCVKYFDFSIKKGCFFVKINLKNPICGLIFPEHLIVNKKVIYKEWMIPEKAR